MLALTGISILCLLDPPKNVVGVQGRGWKKCRLLPAMVNSGINISEVITYEYFLHHKMKHMHLCQMINAIFFLLTMYFFLVGSRGAAIIAFFLSGSRRQNDNYGSSPSQDTETGKCYHSLMMKNWRLPTPCYFTSKWQKYKDPKYKLSSSSSSQPPSMFWQAWKRKDHTYCFLSGTNFAFCVTKKYLSSFCLSWYPKVKNMKLHK